MQGLFSNFKIQINENIYLKDPESSKLGKKIIDHSILLIDEIGFEHFTFKKLADKIGSTESSIYRYFENKHQLLVYLTDWYWSWMEYKLVFNTHNMSNPSSKLELALEIVTMAPEKDENFSHINEVVLGSIVISEFSKSYLTKEVDQENKEGYFATFKRLVGRVAQFITEVNPQYPHPRSLVSTVIQGALHQQYSKAHLPSLTDFNDNKELVDFYKQLVLTQINA
ncbi:TetR/AcrR family transcriptional regulator [Robertkochia sediminum]|uniref:TetR/AcrR family transcriptional regulator n=1 Tax=Robertkochia sediminum TaxID=2785326 RepID=UPI001931C2DA|nr:TetR/AcrR family transcriptional regulator [Robertkochia sediminum]MBL7471693.1 TetR/AcrR family transcriptional regulator [Robertkochia sediminum]